MKKFFTVCATAAVLLNAPAAFAIPVPYGVPGVAQDQFRFDDKLYGFGWTVVNPDGSARITARFSNSRKLEGSKQVNVFVQIMAGETMLYGVQLRANLPDPIFHGGTFEEDQINDFKLTPEQWASVTQIKYGFKQSPTAADCEFFLQKAMENDRFFFNAQLFGCPS